MDSVRHCAMLACSLGIEWEAHRDVVRGKLCGKYRNRKPSGRCCAQVGWTLNIFNLQLRAKPEKKVIMGIL